MKIIQVSIGLGSLIRWSKTYTLISLFLVYSINSSEQTKSEEIGHENYGFDESSTTPPISLWDSDKFHQISVEIIRNV